jgi:hypothetical protein
LSKEATHLTQVSLKGCVLISDIAVHSLVQLCLKVRYLDLAGCVRISDEGLTYVSNHPNARSHLHALDISRCPLVSDEAMTRLAFNCTQLHSLKLNDCPLLTQACINKVASECKYLQVFQAKIATEAGNNDDHDDHDEDEAADMV